VLRPVQADFCELPAHPATTSEFKQVVFFDLTTSTEAVSAVALAPVAVDPAHQRQGIGSRLIQRGLELLRNQGEKIVIVVGHPAYYPRFGFSTLSAEGLESPFPREAFMALELTVGALDGIRGSVVYPLAFGI
jgi:putative acetyltransferase